MTRGEFIQRLVENGFELECNWLDVYKNKITGIQLGILNQQDGFIFNFDGKVYKYTEANLQELINASKVYERLEKLE